MYKVAFTAYADNEFLHTSAHLMRADRRYFYLVKFTVSYGSIYSDRHYSVAVAMAAIGGNQTADRAHQDAATWIATRPFRVSSWSRDLSVPPQTTTDYETIKASLGQVTTTATITCG